MIAHRHMRYPLRSDGYVPPWRNWIVNSWLASYRDADTAGLIAVDDWHAVMVPQITKLLAAPDVVATVAYEADNDDDGSNAYGFIVSDTTERPALVYYAYVAAAARRSGIARGLFAAIGVDPAMPFNYVCSTPWVSRLQRKIPMSRWTPRLGRFPKHERRNSRT